MSLKFLNIQKTQIPKPVANRNEYFAVWFKILNIRTSLRCLRLEFSIHQPVSLCILKIKKFVTQELFSLYKLNFLLDLSWQLYNI